MNLHARPSLASALRYCRSFSGMVIVSLYQVVSCFKTFSTSCGVMCLHFPLIVIFLLVSPLFKTRAAQKLFYCLSQCSRDDLSTVLFRLLHPFRVVDWSRLSIAQKVLPKY